MKIKSPEVATNFKSSFLSCEKDQELIWKKLFVENRPYSDLLKRLLVVNTHDCLDTTNMQYQDMIDKYNLGRLRREKYLRVVPRLEFEDHEQVKSYVVLCAISFMIVCHLDEWELDDYKLRPWQIAGYIDGILNNCKLTGIGELSFLSASEVPFNEHLAGVLLRYVATHSNEADKNPNMLEK